MLAGVYSEKKWQRIITQYQVGGDKVYMKLYSDSDSDTPKRKPTPKPTPKPTGKPNKTNQN